MLALGVYSTVIVSDFHSISLVTLGSKQCMCMLSNIIIFINPSFALRCYWIQVIMKLMRHSNRPSVNPQYAEQHFHVTLKANQQWIKSYYGHLNRITSIMMERRARAQGRAEIDL